MLRYITLLFLIIALTAFPQKRDYSSVNQDSAASVSDAFAVPDGYYLGGLVCPARSAGQDTIFFLVSHNATDANFDTLWYGGAIYYEAIDTLSMNLSLDFKKEWVWEWYKIVTDQAVADDVTWIAYFVELKR